MSDTYWVIRRRDPAKESANDVVAISTRAVRPVRQFFGGDVADPPAVTGPPLKLAGTGLRLPTDLLTRSGNNFVAGDFAVGMPDYEVSEVWFFFPTFAAETGGETLGTSTITIEGMATRSSNGDRTLGTIDDGTDPIVINPAVAATQNGKWVKFTPATPIAAGETQVFAVAQQISDGTYPNRRISSLGGTSIWGGTVKDERSQGGTSSLLSTLSGSANYSNVNGRIVAPSHMLVATPSGKTSWFVVGDSKGYGADMTIRHQFLTSRHAFSFIDMGLDENTQSSRIQFSNSCVPGWGFLASSTTSSHGNSTASARQLWMMEKARQLNSDRPIADAVLCQHGSNSSNASLADQLAGARSLASIWRAAIGGDESTPLYWLRADAYPSSTDGYNTLENQSPSNASQEYPGGNRWLFSAELADGGDLRTDGTVQDAVDLSNISSAPDPDRDLFKVRPFNTTLAADYSGTGDLSFTDEPALGDYLSFFDGTTTTYGHVEAVSGIGPYSVTIAAAVPAYVAADTDIRSTYSGSGLHPGALYHGELAYDADDGVLALKIALGLVPPAAAPVLSGVSISGTPQDGETLTANYTVTGFPAPTITFQWQKNGTNISGETSQTITLDGSSMGLTGGDTISWEITATNSEGSDTAEPTTTYVVPVLADAPLLVDSISGSGSGGSISASGLAATGINRQVFAMVGTGTDDGPTDVALSITGASGTVAMTREFFLGTNNENPAAALECFAGFTADEADLAAAGDGPYSFSGTVSAPGSVDFFTIVAGSVEDAPNSPVIATNRNISVTATPASDKSFIFAGLGSSTASSAADMTGATQLENVASNDGLQLGHVTQTTEAELTVTNSVVARSVSALAIYAPGTV